MLKTYKYSCNIYNRLTLIQNAYRLNGVFIIYSTRIKVNPKK